jgi:hypothetical protein
VAPFFHRNLKGYITMKFVFLRDRTIVSTCGLSIAYKKGEPRLTPPAMYEEVLAAGGVPEEELPEDQKPKDTTSPAAVAARERTIFEAYKKIVLRNSRNEFTAGGAPHAAVVSAETGLAIDSKERDLTWHKFQAHVDD